MCGIIGVLSGAQERESSLLRMVERGVSDLRHRGPDACGTWLAPSIALGHTRLSILDLSVNGNQPMHDESGRWTLVYNGEVYNYLELREQLRDRGHRFRGDSDTEVVLAALIEWGESALQRFNGMWALALWDELAQMLFVARDRAGKKPFYHVTLPGGGFAFSSEISPLLRMGAPARVNRQAAFDFLTQGTYGHLGSQTFYQDISQLPPAHLGRIVPGGSLQVERYWDITVVSRRERLPYDDGFRLRFRELLTDAVRVRLRSDVPVGATLSGGLDSSAIVLLMDRISEGAPLHVFTSQFPGTAHDESGYFDAVVERLRQPIVHRTGISGSEWANDLLTVLDHQEEPFGDTSILAHFALMRSAREAGVPVVLNGQGGDELLLGYPSMVTAYLGAELASGNAFALIQALRWSSACEIPRATALRNLLGATLPISIRDRIRQKFVRRMADRVSPALRSTASLARYEADGRDALSSYLRQVFTRFAIPHLTHYDDRNAMAVSVEGRMPFLDYRLVELMFSVDGGALFANGFTKRVLRDSLAELLPPSVINRRDKIGFYTPLARWLQENIAWVQSVMSADRINAYGLLRSDRYAEALSQLGSGRTDIALEVWRGFIVQLWMDRFSVSGVEPTTVAA